MITPIKEQITQIKTASQTICVIFFEICLIKLLLGFSAITTVAYAMNTPSLNSEQGMDNSDLRHRAMEETLYAMETKTDALTQGANQPDKGEEETDYIQEPRAALGWFKDDAYFSLGIELGYLKGNTTYDFDHHTSELEFPMDNLMVGADLSLGYKDLSLNAEFFTPTENYAGFKMKDKDWSTNGTLTSYTKSKAEMDAIIWDANLRYDFYKKVSSTQGESESWWENSERASKLKFDVIKIGALLGYKYERFDYDMYDIWQQLDNTSTNQGQRVLTYNIKYYLPYLGIATDLLRKNWGVGFKLKYSFYPTARDEDNHLLRYLTFYGDYERGDERDAQAWMGTISAFYEFIKNWKWKLGLDWTIVRIDGITWDATHDPAWDKDQSTDTKQWIIWSGIEYRF